MLLVLLVVAVAAATRDEPTPLEEARTALDDDEEFAAADTAGLALLGVSSSLKEEGERCANASGTRRSRRCDAYFAGAGHVQIISVQVLGCSRPEIFDVRASLRAYLDDLSSEPESASLPSLPRCA